MNQYKAKLYVKIASLAGDGALCDLLDIPVRNAEHIKSFALTGECRYYSSPSLKAVILKELDFTDHYDSYCAV